MGIVIETEEAVRGGVKEAAPPSRKSSVSGSVRELSTARRKDRTARNCSGWLYAAACRPSIAMMVIDDSAS